MQWDYFDIFICKWYSATDLLLVILKAKHIFLRVWVYFISTNNKTTEFILCISAAQTKRKAIF